MSDGLNPTIPKKTRPVHLFDMPPRVAESGISQVGLVTLTSDEELMAWKTTKGDKAALAMALALSSLVEVNGQPVKRGDGSADSVWKEMSPQARELVLTAYAELHKVEEEDTAAFLKSRKVKVG